MHLFIDTIPSFIMLLNIRKSFSLDYVLIPLRENDVGHSWVLMLRAGSLEK